VEALAKNDLALVKYNSANYDEAIILFKEAVESPGISIATKEKIYRNLAHAFSAIESVDSSLHYSEMAANCFEKGSYEFLVNSADVLLLKGEVKNALRLLKKAYIQEPSGIDVNNSLGLIYLGDYGEEFANETKALKYNLKAFQVNKDRPTEDILARNYYYLEDYINAEKHFSNLRNQFPDMLDYPLNLGMIKYHQKNIREANDLFDLIIAADSSYIDLIQDFKDEMED
jgi:tetratricopeptide (TPR) repeat protein